MVQQLKCINGEIAAMGFGGISIRNAVIFLPPSTPPPTSPFMDVLTGSGGGCAYQFLSHFCRYHPPHLYLRFTLPLPHNLSPPRALPSLPLPLICHHCHPHVHLSIYLPLPIPHHLCSLSEPQYLPLPLPHHLRPPSAPLYISLTIHLPQPPSLSQLLPHCH